MGPKRPKSHRPARTPCWGHFLCRRDLDVAYLDRALAETWVCTAWSPHADAGPPSRARNQLLPLQFGSFFGSPKLACAPRLCSSVVCAPGLVPQRSGVRIPVGQPFFSGGAGSFSQFGAFFIFHFGVYFLGWPKLGSAPRLCSSVVCGSGFCGSPKVWASPVRIPVGLLILKHADFHSLARVRVYSLRISFPGTCPCTIWC